MKVEGHVMSIVISTSLCPPSSSASRRTAGASDISKFQPVACPARDVARAEPLRNDTFKPHLAGMAKHEIAPKRRPSRETRRLVMEAAQPTKHGSVSWQYRNHDAAWNALQDMMTTRH
jgi:hypothetical protein